jgi:N-acyl-D-aspartate/D-glutamate deacylase
LIRRCAVDDGTGAPVRQAAGDATEADIARTADLTREAVQAGALGFATARGIQQKSSTDEPTPSVDWKPSSACA